MFEYLIVVATTLIFFRVVSIRTAVAKKVDKGTQTDPWQSTQVLDLMTLSDESGYTTRQSKNDGTVQFVDWFSSDDDSEVDSSSILLPPNLKRTNSI